MKRYLFPALILIALLLSYGVSSCMLSYRFDVGCEGHLKRAADYAEKQGVTYDDIMAQAHQASVSQTAKPILLLEMLLLA